MNILGRLPFMRNAGEQVVKPPIAKRFARTALKVGAVAGFVWKGRTAAEHVPAPQGVTYLHGTNNWPIPPKKGEIVKIEKGEHLFVAPNNPLGEKVVGEYAAGVGASAHRPFQDDPETGHPSVILKVEPVKNAYMGKGFFGGAPYFKEGSELEVKDVVYLSPEEIEHIRAKHRGVSRLEKGEWG